MQTEDQVVEQEQVEVSEVEQEARHQGWVPKDEFRGKESDWIEAEVFVQRGKEINPILKKNNERLLRELDSQKKEMGELRAATEEFKKFQKEQYERKASSLETEIKSLREQKKQAITQGDGELAVNIDDQIDALKEEKSQAREDSKEAPPARQAEPVSPEVAEWVEQNKWYSTDVRMAAAANVIAEDIKRSQPWIQGKEFFKELDKALEENFTPERLGKSSRKSVRSPVEGASPSGASSRGGKQSYDNLPADAKTACDNFVKQKLMSREDYVSSYFS